MEVSISHSVDKSDVGPDGMYDYYYNYYVYVFSFESLSIRARAYRDTIAEVAILGAEADGRLLRLDEVYGRDELKQAAAYLTDRDFSIEVLGPEGYEPLDRVRTGFEAVN